MGSVGNGDRRTVSRVDMMVGYDNGVRYWGGVCANICRKLTTVSFEGRLCDNYIHMMDLFSRFTNMGLLQIQLKRVTEMENCGGLKPKSQILENKLNKRQSRPTPACLTLPAGALFEQTLLLIHIRAKRLTK
jgi:hypothetical protein